MINKLFHFFISLSLITLHAPLYATGAPLMQTSIAPMLEKVKPGIVNINAAIKITDFNTLREIIKENSNKPNPGQEQILPNTYMSVGSGVIVDANNGYILTNAHVINDAQTITITLMDGRHFTAKVVGTDKPSDVALLQIKAKNLTAIPLGDSNKIKAGDFVAAIGSPFGLSQSVSSGVISAVGRSVLGIENYENFIQTDAPINPGNSGGALMNMNGELIGINTAILAPNKGNVGIGFAIPANMAKSVMMQFLQYGDVKRGILGIGSQDLTPELASAFDLSIEKGAVITQVLPNSPAKEGGLEIGDVITHINQNVIKSASDVVNTIGFLRVDSKINIDILRQNKKMTVVVTLTDPKKREKNIEQQDPFLYGTALKNFTLLSPLHGNVKGVLVVAVQQDSSSWNADLRPGDVITSVNQRKVRNIEELKTEVSKAQNTLLLNVLRGAGGYFLVINKDT